jgi:hypothetical protein
MPMENVSSSEICHRYDINYSQKRDRGIIVNTVLAVIKSILNYSTVHGYYHHHFGQYKNHLKLNLARKGIRASLCDIPRATNEWNG